MRYKNNEHKYVCGNVFYSMYMYVKVMRVMKVCERPTYLRKESFFCCWFCGIIRYDY